MQVNTVTNKNSSDNNISEPNRIDEVYVDNNSSHTTENNTNISVKSDALKDIIDIVKSSSKSSKNMEKLTITVAMMTIASLTVSISTLTINAFEGTKYSSLYNWSCWLVGIVVTLICLSNIIVLLKRGDYISKNPHLSRVNTYKKYCRVVGLSSAVDIFCFIYCGLLGLISINALIDNNFSVISSYWSLSIIILVIILILKIIFNIIYKSSFNLLYYSLFIPVIIITIFNVLSQIIVINYIATAICLFYSIPMAIYALLNIILIFTLYFKSKQNLDYKYEFKSDEIHTGIIVIINFNKINSTPHTGLYVLADHLMKDLKESYRIYFCFRKDQVLNVLNDELVNKVFIIGNSDKKRKKIFSKSDYNDSGLGETKFNGAKYSDITCSNKDIKSMIREWRDSEEELED